MKTLHAWEIKYLHPEDDVTLPQQGKDSGGEEADPGEPQGQGESECDVQEPPVVVVVVVSMCAAAHTPPA